MFIDKLCGIGAAGCGSGAFANDLHSMEEKKSSNHAVQISRSFICHSLACIPKYLPIFSLYLTIKHLYFTYFNSMQFHFCLILHFILHIQSFHVLSFFGMHLQYLNKYTYFHLYFISIIYYLFLFI